jgi:hypothetical protein
MQQVLETPGIQDEEQSYVAIEESPASIPSQERAAAATEKTHQPITLLRSVMSVFTGSKPEYIPEEYSAIIKRQEMPLDHLCRTDPYLCIRALCG